MSKTAARFFLSVLLGLFFFAGRVFPAPEDGISGDGGMNWGAIPEALIRPQRGEAPRYPVDTVIGSLGRGEAPEEAYLFAREVAAALAAGNLSHPSLKAMDSPSLEAFISELNKISPRAGRLGSGREEPDGAVSFLVHFLGRERGITGELYVRAAGDRRIEAARQPAAAEPAGENGQTEEAGSDGASETTLPAETTGDSETAPPAETAVPAPSPAASDPAEWQFEDLILEEARERGMEDNHRFDFPPYERFF